MKPKLDLQQRAAVITSSTSALVLAGAGSGKTRVLTERIAYLIEERQVSPYEIMAFTFTRRAAGEIRDRLEKRIGTAAYRCILGTMHAVALQMLRRFGEIVSVRPDNITVYSEWEEQYLLKEVAIELGIFKKSWKISKKKIDEMFADYYQRCIEPDEFNDGRKLFKTFMARCRENNALTYGGLLIGFEMLIDTVAKYLNIQHILVDEVQDIDPLQWRIIKRLKDACGASLFASGDIDQSIFEFRGAVPDYLIDHRDEFDIYHLETNYRSVRPIVQAANQLIAHNAARIEKTMVHSRPEHDGAVEVLKDLDSDGILKLIQASDLSESAILARNHILLKKLSGLLSENEIDHTYIGQKSALTNSEEFRRFHAFLKLTVNPYDNFSFLLIRDLIGVSDEVFAEIRLNASMQGLSHFEAWIEMEGGSFMEETWQHFFTVRSHHCFGDEVCRNIYKNILDKRLYQESYEFSLNWFAENQNGTVKDYLDWLATYDLQDEMTEETKGVILCTIHAAKGLEWSTVIIAGANEGLLPSKQAIGNDEIEQERRLAYVAWTRAQDDLILTVRPETKTSETGKVYHNPISRFIAESQL